MIRFILKSFILSGLVAIMMLILGYAVYCAVVLNWKPTALESKHDAIVVLTGSHGRIETGFRLLLNHNAPRLLISGVRSHIPFSDLLDNNTENLSQDERQRIQQHCCITIDYAPTTTEENAKESAKWIEKNNIETIILVTSNLHMPRAYLQFHAFLPSDITVTAHPYHPQKSRMTLVMSFDFWHYTSLEYIKFWGSLFRIARH